MRLGRPYEAEAWISQAEEAKLCEIERRLFGEVGPGMVVTAHLMLTAVLVNFDLIEPHLQPGRWTGGPRMVALRLTLFEVEALDCVERKWRPGARQGASFMLSLAIKHDALLTRLMGRRNGVMCAEGLPGTWLEENDQLEISHYFLADRSRKGRR